MEIVVPAAGLSTRFSGHRPKYLLYDYKNELMLKNAVKQFIDTEHHITIGILNEHDEKFNASSHIFNAIPGCTIVLLKEKTKGPADTVYQILDKIDGDKPFLVKDCDSYFNHNYANTNLSDPNYICTSNIKEHEVLKKLSSKSFVRYNDQDIITDIVEKQVVSDTFCVGGYKFNSMQKYKETFEKLSARTDEIYVSHVIQDMLMQGETFVTNPVRDYVDVGTQSDWEEFNNKPVVFCDIDGTLIKAQSRFGNYNYDSDPIVLEGNYNRIMEYHTKGAQIIFTTAREETYFHSTKRMLEGLGFVNCLLIMGLNNSARILINDYNDANPYPRAIAYNIKRDHDNLKDIMR